MRHSAVSSNELATLCAFGGDAEAWAEFVKRFQRPIALMVTRTARSWGVVSAEQIDDLVQDTFLRLCAENCRLLKVFEPREPDSIVGYLKVIAANVTHDTLRGERSQKRGGQMQRFELSPELGTLDTLYAAKGAEEKPEKTVQLREIDRALVRGIPGTLTERDRTIFWLYFQQGFSARDIAEVPAVSLTVKGVESSIHRTTRHLREALKRPGQKVFPEVARS